MTNPEFTKLLRRTALAYNKYKPLLELAEQEYERRYGSNPSDVDDDAWIDSMHGACGACSESITAKEVDEHAKAKMEQLAR